MKNSRLTIKGIALAVSIFVLFACYSNLVLAQSIYQQADCFTLVSVTSESSGCGVSYSTSDCTDGCSGRCIDVTIESCNSYEYPISFQITSLAGKCFTICSPTADYYLGTYDSLWCHSGNHQIVWNHSNTPVGIGPQPTSGTFEICSSEEDAFQIDLIAHSGPLCNSPCSTPGIVKNF
jgi:hypothetical protein